MPYKSKAKRLRYSKLWRRKNPTYMRDYARKHGLLGGARKRYFVELKAEVEL